ncbi:hypothetical protein BH09PSE5_BH09PSE5_08270 [soil metagenome]
MPQSQELVSASDNVFFGIVRGLEAHSFVPAQRLVEGDLATRFNVGRNSVREALQRLNAEGIIEIQRHRGAVIRSLSMRETLDVLDIAELMNGLLARTAALRIKGSGRASALRAVMKELKAADKADDSIAFGAARRHYYRVLLDIAGSRELTRLFPAIQMHIVYAQFRLSDLQAMRVRDYGVIARAVLAADAQAAESAGALHVRHVRAAIEAVSAAA